MGSTKEHAEKTREDLLRAGLKMFSEKGFASTRLEDIAKEANVTRGAFYWHFQNKMDLFLALFERTAEIIKNDMMKFIKPELSPLEKLRAIIIQFVNRYQEDEDYRAIGVLHNSIEWTHEVRDAVEQIFKKFMKQQGKPIVEIIEKGKKTGEIKESLETNTIVKAFKITMAGLTEAVCHPKKKLSKEDIEMITDIFIRGIKK